MWAAIRSDLSEFVSGVAEETDHAIGAGATSNSNAYSDDGDVLGGGFAATGIVQSPHDEVTRLQGHVETFQEPLDESDEAVQAFLDSFKIIDKTQEIAQLLEEYPETIKVHFETLVPTEISYEIFWQRYFYRCDPERIQREWKTENDEDRKARANALAGGLSSVKSLFGGAMAAVSKVVASESRHDGEEMQISPFGFKSASGNHPSGGGLNLFGSGGRPPFVMNTAVDEDEDDAEEEEELGWDDDDEEEIEDEDENPNVMDISEEITFSGGNNPDIDRLSEQLVQALSERDALKETIALQNKEMADLKLGKSDSSSSEKAIQRLKLSLFEKDSELAALKASLEDTHEDDNDSDKPKNDAVKISGLVKEVERLNQIVSEREAELVAAKVVSEESQTDIERVADLSGQKVLQSQLDMAQEENNSLRKALEYMSGTSDELEEVKDRLTAAQLKITALDGELVRTLKDLAEAKNYSTEMKHEVEKLKQQLVALKDVQVPDTHADVQPLPLAAVVKEVERASPSSESTGVKIEPLPRVRPDDAEDEWGDDWGDDEEE